ncbi:uncharacterized protein HD556DRAFT_1528800 [Suillus plorans]|uniref:Uncharacterized protein n=1 Tax=Suillus plorans TaxID=116603 RepID=A0A9P7DFK8_9AGAM|nr:uncharacterized protein HD556DRAFT_1528800 [Suillus plorans]KAG1790609.1 hypothetical protein HD556DRAFT_1528800 [Suillus plorans]
MVRSQVQNFSWTEPLGRFEVRCVVDKSGPVRTYHVAGFDLRFSKSKPHVFGNLSATSVMQLIQAPNIPTVVIHHTDYLPWVLILVFHGLKFMPPAAMSSARRADGSLKDASEIAWYNDAEDDSPMVPPPAPAHNGTLNSFVRRSGRAVKPTEKIRETPSL